MTFGIKWRKKIEVIISSDLEYEDLCAEISFQSEFFGILSQENGFESLEIKIYPPRSDKVWDLKFSELEDAFKTAKEALLKMQKKRE